MKSKIVLALAAASVLTLGASAQDFRAGIRFNEGHQVIRRGYGPALYPAPPVRFETRAYWERIHRARLERARIERERERGRFFRGRW